jgi:plastocyanin
VAAADPAPALTVALTAGGPYPRIVTVQAGQPIVFVNRDTMPRRVTSTARLFDRGPFSSILASSSRHTSFIREPDNRLVLDRPGTYPYVVGGRPRQSGTIVVRGP